MSASTVFELYIQEFGDKLIRYTDTCGIYLLVHEGKVVYVGQSLRIHTRIETHFKDKVFDSAYYFHCPYERLDEAERSFITVFSPKYNKTGRDWTITPRYRYYKHDKKLAAEIERRITAGQYTHETMVGLSELHLISGKFEGERA